MIRGPPYQFHKPLAYAGYGATDSSLVANPQPSMAKANVLAHSPTGSMDSTNYQAARQVRTPSYAVSPSPNSPQWDYVVGGKTHSPSASVDSTRSYRNTREAPATFSPIERTYSASSSGSPTTTSPTGRFPLRQLTLMGSAPVSRNSSTSTYAKTGQSQQQSISRPFLLSASPTSSNRASLFANPRTPPSPPSAIARQR